MPYAIFDIEREHVNKIREVLKDDLISRQSIVVRDAVCFGLKKDKRLVLIEGSEDAIARAEELFKKIGTREAGEEAEQTYKKFKEEEENVASGIGTIFD